MSGRWNAVVERLREVVRNVVELEERRDLLNRPWEEDSLHWGRDGRLHGHTMPSAGGRPRGVTSSGWCPGLRE